MLTFFHAVSCVCISGNSDYHIYVISVLMEKFYFNKLIQKFINLKNKFQKIDCT